MRRLGESLVPSYCIASQSITRSTAIFCAAEDTSPPLDEALAGLRRLDDLACVLY